MKMKEGGTRIDRVHGLIEVMQKNMECAICLDLLKNPVSTKCDHQFCRFCITEFLQSKASAPCPLCKKPVTKRSLVDRPKLADIVSGIRQLISAFHTDTGVKVSHLLNSDPPIPTGSSVSAAPTGKRTRTARQGGRKQQNVRQSKRRKTEETQVFIDEITEPEDPPELVVTHVNVSGGFPASKGKSGKNTRKGKSSTKGKSTGRERQLHPDTDQRDGNMGEIELVRYLEEGSCGAEDERSKVTATTDDNIKPSALQKNRTECLALHEETGIVPETETTEVTVFENTYTGDVPSDIIRTSNCEGQEKVRKVKEILEHNAGFKEHEENSLEEWSSEDELLLGQEDFVKAISKPHHKLGTSVTKTKNGHKPEKRLHAGKDKPVSNNSKDVNVNSTDGLDYGFMEEKFGPSSGRSSISSSLQGTSVCNRSKNLNENYTDSPHLERSRFVRTYGVGKRNKKVTNWIYHIPKATESKDQDGTGNTSVRLPDCHVTAENLDDTDGYDESSSGEENDKTEHQPVLVRRIFKSRHPSTCHSSVVPNSNTVEGTAVSASQDDPYRFIPSQRTPKQVKKKRAVRKKPRPKPKARQKLERKQPVVVVPKDVEPKFHQGNQEAVVSCPEIPAVVSKEAEPKLHHGIEEASARCPEIPAQTIEETQPFSPNLATCRSSEIQSVEEDNLDVHLMDITDKNSSVKSVEHTINPEGMSEQVSVLKNRKVVELMLQESPIHEGTGKDAGTVSSDSDINTIPPTAVPFVAPLKRPVRNQNKSRKQVSPLILENSLPSETEDSFRKTRSRPRKRSARNQDTKEEDQKAMDKLISKISQAEDFDLLFCSQDVQSRMGQDQNVVGVSPDNRPVYAGANESEHVNVTEQSEVNDTTLTSKIDNLDCGDKKRAGTVESAVVDSDDLSCVPPTAGVTNFITTCKTSTIAPHSAKNVKGHVNQNIVPSPNSSPNILPSADIIAPTLSKMGKLLKSLGVQRKSTSNSADATALSAKPSHKPTSMSTARITPVDIVESSTMGQTDPGHRKDDSENEEKETAVASRDETVISETNATSLPTHKPGDGLKPVSPRVTDLAAPSPYGPSVLLYTEDSDSSSTEDLHIHPTSQEYAPLTSQEYAPPTACNGEEMSHVKSSTTEAQEKADPKNSHNVQEIQEVVNTVPETLGAENVENESPEKAGVARAGDGQKQKPDPSEKQTKSAPSSSVIQPSTVEKSGNQSNSCIVKSNESLIVESAVPKTPLIVDDFDNTCSNSVREKNFTESNNFNTEMEIELLEGVQQSMEQQEAVRRKGDGNCGATPPDSLRIMEEDLPEDTCIQDTPLEEWNSGGQENTEKDMLVETSEVQNIENVLDVQQVTEASADCGKLSANTGSLCGKVQNSSDQPVQKGTVNSEVSGEIQTCDRNSNGGFVPERKDKQTTANSSGQLSGESPSCIQNTMASSCGILAEPTLAKSSGNPADKEFSDLNSSSDIISVTPGASGVVKKAIKTSVESNSKGTDPETSTGRDVLSAEFPVVCPAQEEAPLPSMRTRSRRLRRSQLVGEATPDIIDEREPCSVVSTPPQLDVMDSLGVPSTLTSSAGSHFSTSNVSKITQGEASVSIIEKVVPLSVSPSLALVQSLQVDLGKQTPSETVQPEAAETLPPDREITSHADSECVAVGRLTEETLPPSIEICTSGQSFVEKPFIPPVHSQKSNVSVQDSLAVIPCSIEETQSTSRQLRRTKRKRTRASAFTDSVVDLDSESDSKVEPIVTRRRKRTRNSRNESQVTGSLQLQSTSSLSQSILIEAEKDGMKIRQGESVSDDVLDIPKTVGSDGNASGKKTKLKTVDPQELDHSENVKSNNPEVSIDLIESLPDLCLTQTSKATNREATSLISPDKSFHQSLTLISDLAKSQALKNKMSNISIHVCNPTDSFSKTTTDHNSVLTRSSVKKGTKSSCSDGQIQKSGSQKADGSFVKLQRRRKKKERKPVIVETDSDSTDSPFELDLTADLETEQDDKAENASSPKTSLPGLSSPVAENQEPEDLQSQVKNADLHLMGESPEKEECINSLEDLIGSPLEGTPSKRLSPSQVASRETGNASRSKQNLEQVLNEEKNTQITLECAGKEADQTVERSQELERVQSEMTPSEDAECGDITQHQNTELSQQVCCQEDGLSQVTECSQDDDCSQKSRAANQTSSALSSQSDVMGTQQRSKLEQDVERMRKEIEFLEAQLAARDSVLMDTTFSDSSKLNKTAFEDAYERKNRVESDFVEEADKAVVEVSRKKSPVAGKAEKETGISKRNLRSSSRQHSFSDISSTFKQRTSQKSPKPKDLESDLEIDLRTPEPPCSEIMTLSPEKSSHNNVQEKTEDLDTVLESPQAEPNMKSQSTFANLSDKETEEMTKQPHQMTEPEEVLVDTDDDLTNEIPPTDQAKGGNPGGASSGEESEDLFLSPRSPSPPPELTPKKIPNSAVSQVVNKLKAMFKSGSPGRPGNSPNKPYSLLSQTPPESPLRANPHQETGSLNSDLSSNAVGCLPEKGQRVTRNSPAQLEIPAQVKPREFQSPAFAGVSLAKKALLLKTPSRAVNSPTQITPSRDVNTNRKLCFVTTGLHLQQARNVQNFAKLVDAKLQPKFSPAATHVIVKPVSEDSLVCERTFKYFQGIAHHCWLVSYQWVEDSVTASEILPETAYEIQGDTVGGVKHRGPRRSRLFTAPIFSDLEFYCHGDSPNIPPGEFEKLLLVSGATVVTSPEALGVDPDKTQLIIDLSETQTPAHVKVFNKLYKKYGIVTVSREWVFDSITQYKTQPLAEYVYTTLPNIDIPFV